MRNTRRTGSPEKKPTEPKIKEEDEPPRKSRKVASPQESGSTARPRRNAKKSSLFTSGEYEVAFPAQGVEKEEQDDEFTDPTMTEQPQETIPPPVASTTRTTTKGRPRRQPPPISPVNHEEQLEEQLDVEGGETIVVDEQGTSHDVHMIDIDHLGGEVDVETMSNLEEAEHDAMKTYDYEEDNDAPPLLERASDMKRKRGRPRKYPQGQTPFRRTNNNRPRSQVNRDPTMPIPRNKYVYDKPLTKIEAEKINSFNVKLFDDNVGMTENGDVYATVIPGCLSYLLRKERIIELLTNRSEIAAIREQGWMSTKPPRLPPLSTSKVCYAFYVDGTAITSIRDLSADDLKPWTTSSNDPAHNEPVVKPNVRKHPIIRQGGRLVPTKGDPRGAEIHLTEYSAWLPRCLRLRKKIYYLARSGHIIGNVLILYDFTTTGEVPVLVNVVHGNEAFRGNHTDEEFERGHLLRVADHEYPFEEEMIAGPKGERFLEVNKHKYGWTNNKTLLLRWLINDHNLVIDHNCLNHHIPYLPPLIEGRGVFVFFAPAAAIADQLHFTGDGLSPWTYQGAMVNHRVRTVKKGLIQDSSGYFQQTKDEWQVTGLALVETITILCRCPRLRKRIIYVQRSNTQILGNVCYIYEYMQPGPIPEIIKTNNRASTAALPPSDIMLRHEKDRMMDEDVDVEDLVEDGIAQDELHQQNHLSSAYPEEISHYGEQLPEDSLNDGWDTEFEEDVLVSQESSSPFFEGVRHLEDGHTYLTVRHKRILCNSDTILEFIANSDFVDEKQLMNISKPSHPPLVRNARAYVFFVSGNVVFPHDINRDDFSPWSANATAERPTCYRSKVRKFPVSRNPKDGRYTIQEGDYKEFPYHLVSLYSIHPKEDRLRKRIHYLMETATKVIVSHVMIMYDYNQEGQIPKVNGPYGKRRILRRPLRRALMTGDPVQDVIDDLSEESESEKMSPFVDGVRTMDNGDMYLQLDDNDFLQDRNRQLHYLYNKPHILENLGCLNSHVPQLPPFIPGRGIFVFFIDGNVDNRMLTCDGLGPWSENITLSDGSVMCRRPKSHRLNLALNRADQLRLLRGKPGLKPDGPEYQMHIYAATLPRCTRLKKRVVYITRDNIQIGHSMIAYWYSEDGEIPQPVAHGNSINAENPFQRLPAPVKEEAKQYLVNGVSINEIVKELQAKHNIPVSVRSIQNIRRELRTSGVALPPDPAEEKVNEVYDVDDSMADFIPPDWIPENITVDDEIHIRSRRNQTITTKQVMDTNHLFRYARNLMGLRSDEEAFDAIWKALVNKDEQRFLRNIKSDFGVEIVADDEGAIAIHHGHLYETENGLVTEIVDADTIGEIVDEVVLEEPMEQQEYITETVEVTETEVKEPTPDVNDENDEQNA